MYIERIEPFDLLALNVFRTGMMVDQMSIRQFT
jgi:hypothetical protein